MITSRNVAFCLITSMVSGLLDQLRIFWQFDRVASAFNSSATTWALALDKSKAFDNVWHTGLLQKLKLYGNFCQVFSLTLFFSVIDGLKWCLDLFYKDSFSRCYSIFISLPFGFVWNFYVMHGLALLVATWICLISYGNRYLGLLVF